MKEHPILFSAPMVRAILAGTKTQTRLVVKPCKDLGVGCELAACELAGEVNAGDYINAKYQPGDKLWVRETFAHIYRDNATPPERRSDDVVYKADGFTADEYVYGSWKPSIHMPRWASRITLEVTGVRIEKLQHISVADAVAEGVNVHPDHHGKPRTSIYSPVQAYRDLWESINGPDSWRANPFVWVREFKVLEVKA